MDIPIANVFYLLCYAWDRLEEGKTVAVGATDSPDLPNLLARVLVSGTNHVLRRGLDRGYETFREDTRRPRGRIHAGESTRRLLRPRRQLHCEFDEFTPNTLPNRIIRTTLESLLRHPELKKGLRSEVTGCLRHLLVVEPIALQAGTFRRVQLHGNNAYYDLLIRVCELTWQSWLPTERGAGQKFRSFLDDDKAMAGLFEAFVRNFYRREQQLYQVKRDLLSWVITPVTPDVASWLPRMETDITLRSPERVVVIDTKFYREAFRAHWQQEKLREGHLYQLWAYVTQRQHESPADDRAEGILLYPVVKQRFDHRWETKGHKMRACSLDLGQPWPAIHRDLLALLQLPEAA